jgi:threonine/homoserine/homoserine lactone efflux protein
VCTAFGVASGQACWTLATSAGVAALLVASEPAFLAVKLAGAVPLTLLWLTLYAIAVAKADAFFSRSRVRRALDGLTGAVLVALGLRLATAQR